jgi:predicted O-linked N-acetylglucosamine transferase (SPINDLY family)
MNKIESIIKSAKILCNSSKFIDASNLLRPFIKSQNENPEFLTLMGSIEIANKKFSEGIGLLEKSLLINPKQINARINLGNIYVELKDEEKALQNFKAALEIESSLVQPYFFIGLLLKKHKKFKEALNWFNKALDNNVINEFIYYQLGTIHETLNQKELAYKYFLKSTNFNNKFSLGYLAQANCLHDNYDSKKALEVLDCIPDSSSEFINASLLKGIILTDINLIEDAIECYQKALKINPNVPEIFFNMGNLLSQKKHNYTGALIQYKNAISINPSYAEAHLNLGILLSSMKKFSESLSHLEKSFEINPNQEMTYGSIVHAKMQVCQWRDFNKDIAFIKNALSRQQKILNPFLALHMTDDLDLQLNTARLYSSTLKDYSSLYKKPPKKNSKKIVIGYFSSDFHGHATAHLITELFEYHNKDKFKIIAFSYGLPTRDTWQKRIMAAFDEFIDLNAMSDIEFIRVAQSKNLDIAIDLKGFTQGSRVNMFSARLAPVQISYLGYPGSSGYKHLDYLIADEFIIPKASREFYSEQVLYMPSCYQVNMMHKNISAIKNSHKIFGIPDGMFIFCSFNSSLKITPECFEAWMIILDKVQKSVLWIFESNDEMAVNLKHEATRRKIDPDRLIFAKSLPVEEHLKRLEIADLFLDTFPYNAHTSASDALRAGLPIITISGKSFASRVCGSLLKALSLETLIQNSWPDYINLAIKLAGSNKDLADLKLKLKKNVAESGLFDPKKFTKDFESLLEDTLISFKDRQ